MNPILRGAAVYLFLLLVFRIMGKRTLNETTTFDFVLLLIISEVTQQALVGDDYSITGAGLLICTLMGIDLILTLSKQAFPGIAKLTEGAPLIIVDHGKPLKNRMEKTKVGEDDILHAARLNMGLERMEQIKYAVLEKDGTISIIPLEKQ
jgi:uncharacterized membrane protein YcaP (DUF421 family)